MASNLEKALIFQMRALQLPDPQQEYRFAAESVGTGRGLRARLQERGLKDWRFDFAWPQYGFAVEIEGVTPNGGRHQRIKGFLGDCEKYHAALDLGWNVYRTTAPLINSGRAVKLIDRMIGKVRDWH